MPTLLPTSTDYNQGKQKESLNILKEIENQDNESRSLKSSNSRNFINMNDGMPPLLCNSVDSNHQERKKSLEIVRKIDYQESELESLESKLELHKNENNGLSDVISSNSNNEHYIVKKIDY